MFMSVRGIRIIVRLVDELLDGRWEMKIVEQNDTKIKLSVNTPASASIGQYKVSVVTYSLKGGMIFPYAQNNEFYMLFNPWCEGTHTHRIKLIYLYTCIRVCLNRSLSLSDDPVYLDDEAERREYILNNMGRIYYGTELQIGTRTWNFAQVRTDTILKLFNCPSLSKTRIFENPIKYFTVCHN